MTDDDDQNEFPFTKDPSKLKGVRHSVSVEKGSKGFGFTIIGGDNPEEFLQIKGVVPGGAASRSGNVKQGVISVCVLFFKSRLFL